MSNLTFHHCLRLLLQAATAAGVALLLGCASAPLPDVATQRFDAAYRTGSEKYAAGDLQAAANAFAQAERMAALYDRRAQRLQALLSMGAVAATREDAAAALQAYTLAQAEARGLGDAHSAAVAAAGMAELQRRAGNYAMALQGLEQALAPAALRAESTERLQARLGRALVWNAMGQSAAARDALQALESEARASHGTLLPAVLAGQAVVLRDSGAVAEAIDKTQEALEWDRHFSNPFALAADLELLGKLYLVSGRNTESRVNLERALRIVQTTGQTRAVERLRQLLP
ncbi:MAG: hypothetical protein HXX19_05240 [Rhodoferax sp.]|nr:hypothetical protein [Rhodoferax sp.]